MSLATTALTFETLTGGGACFSKEGGHSGLSCANVASRRIAIASSARRVHVYERSGERLTRPELSIPVGRQMCRRLWNRKKQ